MFGSTLVSLQQHMEQKLGKEAWQSMLASVGLPRDKVYHTIQCYPDDEFEHLVTVGAAKLVLGREVFLRELGVAFGSLILKTYSIVFFHSWRSLDVIEKAAPKVFNSIQFIDPYRPPKSNVKCERVAPEEVVVHYVSSRMMCSYILGIIDAVGLFFNEKLRVAQHQCMHNGAPECEIHVKLISASPHPKN